MTQIIQHIDAIARQKKRAVLFLIFHSNDNKRLNWKNLPIRQTIINWLEVNKIDWEPCGSYANQNRIEPYRGQIYLDIPFNIEDQKYQQLRDYLELPNGEMRFNDVRFCYDTLEHALKNSHQDEPDFWEKWADNF